jgi:hypothetical protein
MKLPKKVFVKVERSRDEEYLVCADDCEALAEEVGGVVEVGTYELVMTGKLATKAEFQADKAKARKTTGR